MKAFLLKPGEEEIATFRQSPAVLFWRVVVVLAFLTLSAWYVSYFVMWGFLGKYFAVLATILSIYLLHSILLWYLDIYRVTTQRFIKSSYRTVFHQHVSETSLERILNISFKTTGLWSVLMNYGDVELQVVGRMEPIVVKNVRNPGTLKEYLLRLHEQTAQTSNQNSIEMSKSGLLPGNK